MPKAQPKRSAGILLFRRSGSEIEVLLAHPGGPLWKNKDEGAWTIPKGEYGDAEEPLAAAKREFAEETGLTPSGEFIPLGEVRQPAGKIVSIWALEGDFDARHLHSNIFAIPWPPNSGKWQEFPEIDRAEWFSLKIARAKILKGQAAVLDRLAQYLLDVP